MEYYDTYTQYLTKKILTTNHKFPSPMNRRLEERTSAAAPPSTAFYDQVPPGGFAWPPRSYTCSFCRREFRSAQALGGHMNVHRRDRARLNQSDQSSTKSPLIEETNLSVGKSCLVDTDRTVGPIVDWCSSMEEIDLELRLGSDPQTVK